MEWYEGHFLGDWTSNSLSFSPSYLKDITSHHDMFPLVFYQIFFFLTMEKSEVILFLEERFADTCKGTCVCKFPWTFMLWTMEFSNQAWREGDFG